MRMIKNLLSCFIIICCGVANAAGQADLLGHKWYLGILNQQALIMADFTVQKPYLEFGANNKFSAFVGCNTITGTYSLTGPNGLHLSASKPTAPAATCKQKFIDIENTFISSLPNIKAWEIENEVLYLKANPNDIVSIAIFAPNKPY